MGADDPALTAEQSSMDGFMRLPEGLCVSASGVYWLVASANQEKKVPPLMSTLAPVMKLAPGDAR